MVTPSSGQFGSRSRAMRPVMPHRPRHARKSLSAAWALPHAAATADAVSHRRGRTPAHPQRLGVATCLLPSDQPLNPRRDIGVHGPQAAPLALPHLDLRHQDTFAVRARCVRERRRTESEAQLAANAGAVEAADDGDHLGPAMGCRLVARDPDTTTGAEAWDGLKDTLALRLAVHWRAPVAARPRSIDRTRAEPAAGARRQRGDRAPRGYQGARVGTTRPWLPPQTRKAVLKHPALCSRIRERYG